MPWQLASGAPGARQLTLGAVVLPLVSAQIAVAKVRNSRGSAPAALAMATRDDCRPYRRPWPFGRLACCFRSAGCLKGVTKPNILRGLRMQPLDAEAVACPCVIRPRATLLTTR